MTTRIAQVAATAAQKLRVRSALNPMLWLTAIASPICFTAAFAFRDVALLLNLLVIIGLVPVLTTCGGFVFFAVTGPEKLQSEDYQLRHETLQMIQQKSGQLTIDPTSLETIANPVLPTLPAAPAEEE